jgi:hypothetical protein
MEDAKKQRYTRLIAKSDNKTKTTWNIMKRETVRIHLIEQLPSLHMNNGTVKDPEALANAFNNFLLTITENSKLYKVEGKKCYFIFKDAFSVKFRGIKISQPLELR